MVALEFSSNNFINFYLPPKFDSCPGSSCENWSGICHYDFFSLQFRVVHQDFYLKLIKNFHDDNNLVMEFKIGHTRKQMITIVLTEVVETYAKFQLHDPGLVDFKNASTNKRLSERIDLLKGPNFSQSAKIANERTFEFSMNGQMIPLSQQNNGMTLKLLQM
ncbi:unnamed protein product [Malus baccata var. baccata]